MAMNKDAYTHFHASFDQLRDTTIPFYTEVGNNYVPRTAGELLTNPILTGYTRSLEIDNDDWPDLYTLNLFPPLYFDEFTLSVMTWCDTADLTGTMTTIDIVDFLPADLSPEDNNRIKLSLLISSTGKRTIQGRLRITKANTVKTFDTVGTFTIDSWNRKILWVVQHDDEDNFYFGYVDETGDFAWLTLAPTDLDSGAAVSLEDWLSDYDRLRPLVANEVYFLVAGGSVNFNWRFQDLHYSCVQRYSPDEPILFYENAETARDVLSVDSDHTFWVGFKEGLLVDESQFPEVFLTEVNYQETSTAYYDGTAGWFDGTAYVHITRTDNCFGVDPDICFKVYFLDTPVTNAGLFGDEKDATNYSHCHITGGNFIFVVVEGGATKINMSVAYTFLPNTWYEIRLLRDELDLNVYLMVNGRIVGSAAYTACTNTGPKTFLGVNKLVHSATPTQYFLNGYMDLFRVSSTRRQQANYYVNPWTDHKLNVVRDWGRDLEVNSPLDLNADFPSHILDAKQINESLYIGGHDIPLKLSNNQVLFVGASSNTPLSADGSGAGSISDGTYDYVYTVTNSVGQESGTTAQGGGAIVASGGGSSVIFQLTGEELRLLLLRDTAELNLYRRRSDTNESNYYFVGSYIPTDITGFNDTGVDLRITDNVATPDYQRPAPFINEQPPACLYVEKHLVNMFYAYPEGEPTKLYFTKQNRFDSVNTSYDFLFIGTDVYDVITGLKSFNNNLIVFKEHSIHSVSGDPEFSPLVRKIADNIGCISNNSIVLFEKLIGFAGNNGFYLLDEGDNLINIALPIEDIFREMPSDRRPFIYSTVDIYRGLILVSLSKTDTTKNDTVLVFNYREFLIDQVIRWTEWPVNQQAGTYSAAAIDGMAAIYNFSFETSGSSFYSFNETAVETFAMKWIGGEYNFNDRGMLEQFRYITVVVNPDGAETIKIGAKINGVETYTTFTANVARQLKKHISGRYPFVTPAILIEACATDVSFSDMVYTTDQIGKR